MRGVVKLMALWSYHVAAVDWSVIVCVCVCVGGFSLGVIGMCTCARTGCPITAGHVGEVQQQNLLSVTVAALAVEK